MVKVVLVSVFGVTSIVVMVNIVSLVKEGVMAVVPGLVKMNAEGIRLSLA
jgi:hypothetical protein